MGVNARLKMQLQAGGGLIVVSGRGVGYAAHDLPSGNPSSGGGTVQSLPAKEQHLAMGDMRFAFPDEVEAHASTTCQRRW